MSPARLIWEVRQRSWDRTVERSLGMFVDDMMADNSIQQCYHQAWQEALAAGIPDIWIPVEAGQQLRVQTYDQWFPNDINGPEPLFYKVPHQLWDQLPSAIPNFVFTLESQY